MDRSNERHDPIAWLRERMFIKAQGFSESDRTYRQGWNDGISAVIRELERREMSAATDRAAVQLLRKEQG